MTEALLVIDVQNDFCPDGALAVAGGDTIVQPINALMDKFNTVVLTQDWHPTDHNHLPRLMKTKALLILLKCRMVIKFFGLIIAFKADGCKISSRFKPQES